MMVQYYVSVNEYVNSCEKCVQSAGRPACYWTRLWKRYWVCVYYLFVRRFINNSALLQYVLRGLGPIVETFVKVRQTDRYVLKAGEAWNKSCRSYSSTSPQHLSASISISYILSIDIAYIHQNGSPTFHLCSPYCCCFCIRSASKLCWWVSTVACSRGLLFNGHVESSRGLKKKCQVPIITRK